MIIGEGILKQILKAYAPAIMLRRFAIPEVLLSISNSHFRRTGIAHADIFKKDNKDFAQQLAEAAVEAPIRPALDKSPYRYILSSSM